MGYIRDIKAMLRMLFRAEKAVLRKEAQMVSKFTPEGQRRYRRWRRLLILAGINKKVTGYW